MEIINRTILIGDVLEKIKEIPENSIDCVITSPPYWGLRDYGSPGQWGLEQDFNEYLGKLKTLMSELRRVVKDTGTIWVNLGDTYGTVSGNYEQASKGNAKDYEGMKENNLDQYPSQKNMKKNVQSKSRVGIPERFYTQCIDDGWIARNHIPWIKPNHMPSSALDRFTNTWESIFFFAKKQKYFFDLDSVREKPLTELKAPKPKAEKKLGKLFDDEQIEQLESERKMLDVPGQQPHSIHKRREQGLTDYERGNQQPDGRSHFGTGGDVKKHMLETRLKREKMFEAMKHTAYSENDLSWMYKDIGVQGQAKSLKERSAYARRVLGLDHDSCLNSPFGKNPGDVIYDKSKPYAVQDRFGTVYYRDLPPIEEIIEYLNYWRTKKGVTIDWLEEQFGNQTAHHWFDKHYGSYPTREDWLKTKELLGFDDKYDKQMTTLYPKPAEKQNNPEGKNPGDVFVINTRPFIGSHFAVFPPELPTKILKCACPQQVCKKCGKPREKIIKSTPLEDTTIDQSKLKIEDSQYKLGKTSALRLKGGADTFYQQKKPDIFLGYTDCGCNAGFDSGFVLDPFFGSGTVGVAAEQLGLNWIGIELKEEYVSEIITKRLDRHKNQRLNEYI